MRITALDPTTANTQEEIQKLGLAIRDRIARINLICILIDANPKDPLTPFLKTDLLDLLEQEGKHPSPLRRSLKAHLQLVPKPLHVVQVENGSSSEPFILDAEELILDYQEAETKLISKVLNAIQKTETAPAHPRYKSVSANLIEAAEKAAKAQAEKAAKERRAQRGTLGGTRENAAPLDPASPPAQLEITTPETKSLPTDDIHPLPTGEAIQPKHPEKDSSVVSAMGTRTSFPPKPPPYPINLERLSRQYALKKLQKAISLLIEDPELGSRPKLEVDALKYIQKIRDLDAYELKVIPDDQVAVDYNSTGQLWIKAEEKKAMDGTRAARIETVVSYRVLDSENHWVEGTIEPRELEQQLSKSALNARIKNTQQRTRHRTEKSRASLALFAFGRTLQLGRLEALQYFANDLLQITFKRGHTRSKPGISSFSALVETIESAYLDEKSGEKSNQLPVPTGNPGAHGRGRAKTIIGLLKELDNSNPTALKEEDSESFKKLLKIALFIKSGLLQDYDDTAENRDPHLRLLLDDPAGTTSEARHLHNSFFSPNSFRFFGFRYHRSGMGEQSLRRCLARHFGIDDLAIREDSVYQIMKKMVPNGLDHILCPASTTAPSDAKKKEKTERRTASPKR